MAKKKKPIWKTKKPRTKKRSKRLTHITVGKDSKGRFYAYDKKKKKRISKKSYETRVKISESRTFKPTIKTDLAQGRNINITDWSDKEIRQRLSRYKSYTVYLAWIYIRYTYMDNPAKLGRPLTTVSSAYDVPDVIDDYAGTFGEAFLEQGMTFERLNDVSVLRIEMRFRKARKK